MLKNLSQCKIPHKHLPSLMDYSKDDIISILSAANILKNNPPVSASTTLSGRTLAMIFSKSSTRTRVSFEQGVKALGGSAIFLSTNDIQLGRGETIHDTAKTLSRYVHGIMIRTHAQSDVDELSKHSSVPVINGLTDDYHPCQALADYLTVYEKFGKFDGIKLAYIGDGNNVAHSLMIAGAKLGVEVVVICPKGHEPNAAITAKTKSMGNVTVTSDIDNAIKGCHVVYTDVMFSMGQTVTDAKKAALMPYQVNSALMNKAHKDAIFMHCLPAHRDEEVTGEVIDGPQSVVFDQAENRMWAQMGVMWHLMK